MDPIIAGSLMILIMLLCTALGVPVAIGMAGVAFFGMWWFAGLDFTLGTFMTLPYSFGANYGFVVIPMFVLMGSLAATAGITTELYTAAHRVLSGIRGSLYYATIVASAAFGAVSGSTVVSAAVLTKVALPEMLRFGYSRQISAGLIASAGTFDALIPPSISLAIYGILTGESIGKLLFAGLLPGLFTAGVYMIAMRVFLRYRPEWAPRDVPRFPVGKILESFKGLWAVLVLVVVVLGGIYSGLVAPSAAGTLGAAGALVICLLRRKITRAGLWEALREAAAITAVLFLIIIGGMLFTRLLLFMGFMSEITKFASSGLTPTTLILFIVVIYLVLGCFLDTVSMMIMTIPFLYPIGKALGIDGLWLGVIIVKLVEISAITPPVGLNLYATMAAADGRVTTSELFKGVVPFIALEIVVLAILIAFPSISLWLPNAMVK